MTPAEKPPVPPDETDVVACDVCGKVVPHADAVLEEADDGEVYTYCSVACQEHREFVDIDRGADPDEDRGIDAAP